MNVSTAMTPTLISRLLGPFSSPKGIENLADTIVLMSASMEGLGQTWHRLYISPCGRSGQSPGIRRLAIKPFRQRALRHACSR